MQHLAIFLNHRTPHFSTTTSYRHALTQQPKWDVLESVPYLEQLSWLVLAFGMTLVCSSMYALGWKNTFMGTCTSVDSVLYAQCQLTGLLSAR